MIDLVGLRWGVYIYRYVPAGGGLGRYKNTNVVRQKLDSHFVFECALHLSQFPIVFLSHFIWENLR